MPIPANLANPFGYLARPREVEKWAAKSQTPSFSISGAPIRGTGRGKSALLYKAYEKVNGAPLFPVTQGIGDCVSHGWAVAIRCTAACEILAGDAEELREPSTEAIYSLSRVQVGKGQLGNEDGSVGAWAAEAVQQHGVLPRGVYGEWDVSKYDPAIAKRWGRRGYGLPAALRPEAKPHTIKTVSLITTWEDLCDALYNGYGVAICSNQGFNDKRDKNGFLKAEGVWPHCMPVVGYVDEGPNPGACFFQSWGPEWCSGGTRLDQPLGSFWARPETVARMLKNQPDSYAASQFAGYRRRDGWVDHSPL